MSAVIRQRNKNKEKENVNYTIQTQKWLVFNRPIQAQKTLAEDAGRQISQSDGKTQIYVIFKSTLLSAFSAGR